MGKTVKRKTIDKPKKGRAEVAGVSPVKRAKHGGSGKASSRADPVAILESSAHTQTAPDTAGPFARNMDNLTVNSASASTAGSIHAEQALADQPSKPADQTCSSGANAGGVLPNQSLTLLLDSIQTTSLYTRLQPLLLSVLTAVRFMLM